MGQHLLSACIVVYNGAAEALRAACSVLEHTKKYPLTLYLVDNASPDGSGAALCAALGSGVVRRDDGTLWLCGVNGAAEAEKAAETSAERLSPAENQAVCVICRETNGGFGTGHNRVLPLLRSDFHFILNPDILLAEDTLSEMADWMQAHPDCVMARPALVFPDGQPQTLPLQKCSALALVYRQKESLTFLKPFNDRYVMAGTDLSKPTEIEFCTGSFSALRTETFLDIGGFDEGYFMYVEDADLTQKARRKGKVYLLPQYSAIHAWHRAPHTDGSHFKMQLKSMLRYFGKWGFRL